MYGVHLKTPQLENGLIYFTNRWQVSYGPTLIRRYLHYLLQSQIEDPLNVLKIFWLISQWMLSQLCHSLVFILTLPRLLAKLDAVIWFIKLMWHTVSANPNTWILVAWNFTSANQFALLHRANEQQRAYWGDLIKTLESPRNVAIIM